jgi:hypothetical protein
MEGGGARACGASSRSTHACPFRVFPKISVAGLRFPVSRLTFSAFLPRTQNPKPPSRLLAENLPFFALARPVSPS